MIRSAAQWVKRALLAGGHYRRRLQARRLPGVAVLCYHGVRGGGVDASAVPFGALHVTADELDAHCRVVRELCDPISLVDWRRALAGTGTLPRRPVLFTFDDGYQSVLSLARPILRRHGIPAVFFLCSGPIAGRGPLWYDAVARAHGDAEVERLKSAPYGDWQALAGLWGRPTAADDLLRPVTPDELRQLATEEGVEIGAHTTNHPILARAPADVQREEIVACKTQLEAWGGRPVAAFAYPNGRPRLDYTDETVALVREAGFDFGFTTQSGFATAGEPPLERSRFVMLAGIEPAELAHRIAYGWQV